MRHLSKSQLEYQRRHFITDDDFIYDSLQTTVGCILVLNGHLKLFQICDMEVRQNLQKSAFGMLMQSETHSFNANRDPCILMEKHTHYLCMAINLHIQTFLNTCTENHC